MQKEESIEDRFKKIEILLVQIYRYLIRGQLSDINFLYPLLISYLLAIPFIYRSRYETVGLFIDPFGLVDKWFHLPFLFRDIISTAIIYGLISIIIGKYLSRDDEDVEDIIAKSKITDANGNGPYITESIQLDDKLIKYKLNSKGIPIEKFRENKSLLESNLDANVPEINQGDTPRKIELLVSKYVIPKIFSFNSVASEIKDPRDFIIGKTLMGLKKVNIIKLPHLLISGTTDSGKSTFTKQLLTGLIKSDPTLKLYLVDLKGGLEFAVFNDYYKSATVENISDAAALLKQVEEEMYKRLKMLKSKGDVKFDPKVHGDEYIILCIDEASVLFSKRDASDPNSEEIISARSTINNISKLSRASGIHIIACTQKVDMSSIPTQTQENFSGKVSFHANTQEASMRSVGGTKAKYLPKYPGRGIWSYGRDTFEFQSPFIENKDIKKYFPNISKLKVNLEKKDKSISEFNKMKKEDLDDENGSSS